MSERNSSHTGRWVWLRSGMFVIEVRRLAYTHSCIFTIMNEFMFLSFQRRWESTAYSLCSSSQITQHVTAHGNEALLSTSDCKCGRQCSEYFCTTAVALAELTCKNRHGPVAAALEFLRFNLKARKSEDFFTYRSEEQPEELWTAVRVRGESLRCCLRLTFHTADRKTLKWEQGESSTQELRQGATDQRLSLSRSCFSPNWSELFGSSFSSRQWIKSHKTTLCYSYFINTLIFELFQFSLQTQAV